MAALTDLSDLINRMTGGNSGTPVVEFHTKVARVAGAAATATIAGRTASLWRYDGTYGGGAIPTSAAIPTNATQGAFPIDNAGGGRQKWLTQIWGTSLNAGSLVFYDRLFHIGGLSGTSTSEQTVQGSTPTPALTRNTGGLGNFIAYEINTQIGTTATTLTVKYTNQDGDAKTTTINIGNTGFREATRFQIIPLAAGDRGVRAVESVQLSASTGTAGNIGIVIGRRLVYLPVGAVGNPAYRDFTTGLPSIPAMDDNVCVAMFWLASTTAAPEVHMMMSFVEK